MWSTSTLGSSFQYLSYYLTLLIGASMLSTIRNQTLREKFQVKCVKLRPKCLPKERRGDISKMGGMDPKWDGEVPSSFFRQLENAFSSSGRVSEQGCMIWGEARSLPLNCAFDNSFLFIFCQLFTFMFLFRYSCDWAFSNLLELVIWNDREHF